MAANDTLLIFAPQQNLPPASNFATLDTRNGHLCLDFDATAQESAVFAGLLPRHYAGGDLQVLLHWAASSAVTGTVGWDVALERVGEAQLDLDAEGFASAQPVAAADVPGTNGHVKVTSVTLTPAQADSLASGEYFRLRIRRDVAADTAAGDAELWGVEIREA